MNQASPTAAVTSPPDPPKDPPATALLENIDTLLRVGRYLLGYGRHMIDTVRQRAAAPNFAAIAACFGTARLPAIIARLNRGILRCIALERVLLARAAAGRDIPFTPRQRQTLQPGPDAPEPAPAALPQAAEPLLRRTRAPRTSRPAFWDDPELHMPTLEELERQIRRLPIGRVYLAILLDLAVVPAFCHPGLWNALFEIMNWFGGGNAVDTLMREKSRRRAAFEKEQDRNPKATWDWLNMPPTALRQVLGFFIGEPPVNPLDPAAAIATAPP